MMALRTSAPNTSELFLLFWNIAQPIRILLDLTCKTGVNLERTVESMLECQSLCMSICTRWEGEAVELAGELRAWGTNQMAKFRREAEDAVYAHVERIPDIVSGCHSYSKSSQI